MKEGRKMIKAFMVLGILTLIVPGFAAAQNSKNPLSVNCDTGQSVQNALNRVNGPSTIVVTGTCNQNIVIKKDDITLQGGIYVGPNPNQDTISVQGARRVSIKGATVGGARNGIVASQGGSLTIENCNIKNNGGSGVSVTRSSHALIDGNTIESNSRDGVYIDGASATVTNNAIRENQHHGINVNGSGNARIGITDGDQAGPNTIENNVDEGIQISNGANAYLLGNTIKSNGKTTSKAGVGIWRAKGRLIGDNTIQGNGGNGVDMNQGALYQGVGEFDLTPGRDIIKENTLSGISAFNGSSLSVEYATIKDNTQHGISLLTRSTLWIFNSTVSGNALNGIAVYYGSAVMFGGPGYPGPSVTGNTGWGLFCGDNESSYAGNTSGVIGNGAGNVSCTGF